jgi:hypothetical protein
MKTTKRTALNKRIEKLVNSKELNKSSLVYGWISNLQKGQVIRPVYSQGRGWASSSLVDKTMELKIVLQKLKIDFLESNDAPKGGRTGHRVDIVTKVN